MDANVLKTYQDSLERCLANPRFLERFYEVFLASSPKIAERFAHTDFVRQREALKGSLQKMVLAVGDDTGPPEKHLADLAEQHSQRHLNIGAEFYDYWLDSLLTTVREMDPEYDQHVHNAWERIMLIGIGFMLSRYA